MTLEIQESSAAKKTWSTGQCIFLAIISLVIGATIFVLAYISMSQNIYIGTYNQKILTWLINHRDPQITSMMALVSIAADPKVLAVFVFIIAFIWAIIKREIWRPILLASAMVAGAALSTFLKSAIANTRPPEITMIAPIETSYSFPSGHVLGITVFFLVLGYLMFSRSARHSLAFFWTILAAVGIATIAFSRMYLGYHWATDTIASLGLGFILLAVVIFIDRIIISFSER